MGNKKFVKKINHTKQVNTTQQNSKKNFKHYFLLAAIILLTILVFSKSSENEFINYDDNIYVYENAYIKDFSIQGIKEIFKAYSKDELPITLLSLSIDYKLWGLNPKPYHIENIILHLINILLVFVLVKQITKRNEGALISALLFAIHPLRCESVMWVAERKDMLLALFYFSSLICYIKYIKANNKIQLLLSVIFAVLSLLSKFTAVTIPIILILIDYYYSKKFCLKLILEKIPFFILPVMSGIIHYSTEQSNQLVSQFTQSFSFIDSIFMAGYALFFYIYKFFLPFNLSALHAYPSKINNLLPNFYYIYFVISLIISALVAAFIYRTKKFRKELIFGFLFFLITISLVLQIIPFGGWAIVAERYTYIPYFGLFFLTGQFYCWLSDNLINNSKKIIPIFLTILSVYVIIFSIITFNRNEVWKNSITLFDDVLEKDSTVYFAYNNRGFSKFGLNDIEGSLADFNKVIRINPNFIDGYNNRGNLMNQLGNYKEALEDFNKVIKSNPKNSAAYNNRGNSKVGLKDIYGSIADYSKAIEIKSDYSLAYNNRGSVKCNNLNDMEGAINDFTKAILIDKNYGQAYFNRGVCYLNLKNLQKACPDFHKAYQLGYTQAEELIRNYCNN